MKGFFGGNDLFRNLKETFTVPKQSGTMQML